MVVVGLGGGERLDSICTMDSNFLEIDQGMVLVRVDGSHNGSRLSIGDTAIFCRDVTSRNQQGYMGRFVGRKGSFKLTLEALESARLRARVNMIKDLNPFPKIWPGSKKHHELRDPSSKEASCVSIGDTIAVLNSTAEAAIRGRPNLIYTLQNDGHAALKYETTEGTDWIPLRVGVCFKASLKSSEMQLDFDIKLHIMLMSCSPVICTRMCVSAAVELYRSGQIGAVVKKSDEPWICNVGDKFKIGHRMFELTPLTVCHDNEIVPEQQALASSEGSSSSSAVLTTYKNLTADGDSLYNMSEANSFQDNSIPKPTEKSSSDETVSHDYKELLSPELFPANCSKCGASQSERLEPLVDDLGDLLFLCSSCSRNGYENDKIKVRKSLKRRNTALGIFELICGEDGEVNASSREHVAKRLKLVSEYLLEKETAEDKANICQCIEDLLPSSNLEGESDEYSL